jgi:hypothetical protein
MFKSTVTFLTKQQTRSFITSDPDRYFRGLSKYDLYARHSVTVQDYIDKIITEDFPNISKKQITRVCQLIDNYLPIELRNVNWNFALTLGDRYKQGYPHIKF